MIGFVDLNDIKSHLKVDHDLDNADLQEKIKAASAVLLAWMQGHRHEVIDESGNLIEGEPLIRVKESCRRLVGILYRNPDGAEREELQRGELPYTVTCLIHDLRRPTIL